MDGSPRKTRRIEWTLIIWALIPIFVVAAATIGPFPLLRLLKSDGVSHSVVGSWIGTIEPIADSGDAIEPEEADRIARLTDGVEVYDDYLSAVRSFQTAKGKPGNTSQDAGRFCIARGPTEPFCNNKSIVNAHCPE